MEGRARAPGAGTVINALATGTGAAFAIDAYTTATVRLHDQPGVTGHVVDVPDADPTLIELCVEGTIEAYATGDVGGGTVETESEVPMAAGLKSSSAAANASVLATLAALGVAEDVEPIDAARIGVDAAREAGVTVTGAFDDASASMLGGVTITDNHGDQLLDRVPFDRAVAIVTPPERAYSAKADVSRCQRIAPVVEVATELATAHRFGEAMTVNGFAYTAALGFSAEPMIEALPYAEGVTLSGTGPSTIAIGETDRLEGVRELWTESGDVRLLRTQDEGATII